jgi:diguanylate cyclase (GGDEF)-like protein/PAS domain S-box-containing protein
MLSSPPLAADETDVTATASRASWPVPSPRRAPAAFAMPEDADAWHSAADAMAEGLVVQDLRGVITLSNPAAERILGLRSEQMQGKASADSPWRSIYADGRERPGTEHPSMLVLQTGKPRWADVMGLHTPTGDLIWLSVNSVPVHDADGVLTGVVTAFADITAQRVHEQTQLARESRLHAAQQLTGLAWWELNVRTGTHVWSDEMFRLVGLEPGGAPPDLEAYLALLHPADRPAAAALVEQGYDDGHRETFRVIHPDRSVHHLQSWTEVQRDDAGQPVRILGATIDVTERESALERLADGSAKLAAALDLNATAMWEWHVGSGRLTWSARMTELMGRDPNGPPPALEDFLTCLHPDDRERITALGERQVATGVPEETTYRVVHPDGSVRHIRAWTDVRLDRDGHATHLWGTALDITPEQEYAARLRSSEEHFRVAFDLAPIGMSMIGLVDENEGQYLRTNAAFQQMLGRSQEQLRSARMGEITHPDDRERDTAQFAKLVAGEVTSLAFEKRYLRGDGQTVHAWITSSVVHDDHGEPLYLITHAVDISDRLREQAELKRLALTDTLTGLANRTLLNDRLGHALARLERQPSPVAMLLLDIDRFKTVNDSLGHQVGDALLVEVGRRLESVTRGDCTVARLGGDEFVVLVEGLDQADAIHQVAARLLEAMRQPFDLGLAQPITATASIGVSIATDPDRDPSDLYREADLALYRAKDAGRDQYALFDAQLRASADRRLTAETLLRRALSQDCLVPLFQPIVDLGDGRMHGAEALVRIRDEGQLVVPAAFIDVAEETGLIVDVDARMFELVAAEAERLLAVGVPLRRLTTNVSARTLEDPGFLRRARAAIKRHDLPRTLIRIELTERTLLSSTPATREAIAQLLDMGLGIGLDDFGTGYSALGYLQTFPLDFLKIDRSFVSRLGASPRDDAIVEAVIALAHAHDLVVVGEGVETPEQLEALRRIGCDRAQGYLMGRPMAVEDLVELFHADPRW